MSAENRREQHVNSINAYDEGKEEWFSKREKLILAALSGLKRGASDRELMIRLGFTDMNSVRPRITEMVKEGLLEEVSNQEDPITKKVVRVVALARDPRLPQREFDFTLELQNTVTFV